MRITPNHTASVYGIDLGKSVFHVCAIGDDGRPVQRAKFSRHKLLVFFTNTKPALVGLEACPGSQWLARKINHMGHTVRIMPAQYVKPYVKSNKNDTVDA